MAHSENKSYPNHDIDPALKDWKWGLKYAKAMIKDHTDGPFAPYLSSNDRLKANRLYRQGNQDIAQYKKQINCSEENIDNSYLNLNWRVQSALPEHIDVLSGLLHARGFKMNCNALDPVAKNEKEEKKWKQKAIVSLKEKGVLDRWNQLAGQEIVTEDEKGLPNTMEELELWQELPVKLAQEIAGETILEEVFNSNDWDYQLEQVIEDLVIDGIGIVKESVDVANKIKLRRCDATKMVLDFSHNKMFTDIRHAGERCFYTIGQLKEMYGEDALTHAEWCQVAKKAAGKHGNGKWEDSWELNTGDTFGNPWNDMKVEVLDFACYTYDSDVYKEVNTERGHTIVEKAPFDYKPSKKAEAEGRKKRRTLKLRFVYEGVYVLGTDYMLKWGKMPFQPRSRDLRQLAETKLPFHIYAPVLIDGNNKSVVERLRPLADEYYILSMKIQQEILALRPTGLAINLDAVLDITKGKDGKDEYEVLELLDIYNATGNMFYRTTAPGGEFINGRPVDILENGSLSKAMQLMQMRAEISMRMKEISGITDVAAGTESDPKQLVGVSKFKLQTTHNAVRNIWNGVKFLMEDISESIVMRAQALARADELGGYEKAIGSMAAKALAAGAEFQYSELGLMFEEYPSDEEMAKFEAMVQQQLAVRNQTGRGGITLADAYEIMPIKNLKLAQRLLLLRIKKNEEKDMQREQQMSQMQSQSNAQAAQVAEQAKQQTMQLEAQIAIQKIQAENEAKVQLEQVKSDLRMKENEQKAELGLYRDEVMADIKEDQQRLEGDLKKDTVTTQEEIRERKEIKVADIRAEAMEEKAEAKNNSKVLEKEVD